MTTIAYRDGVLAADSLSTAGGYRDDYATKIHRVGRLLVAAAGSRPLCLRFRDWVQGGMIGDSPFEGKEDGNGLVVGPDGIVVCWSGAGPWPVSVPFYTLGSGYQIALGAMEAGADAEEAVRIAMRYDTRTGGDVVVLRLADGP